MRDLYCGAGMAADGYQSAGFTEIEGWDWKRQPAYPYKFHQGDALKVLEDLDYIRTFDLIHASPPCQAHTRAKHLRTAQGRESVYGDLLTPTLTLLRASGVPWVVENVPGAPGMAEAVVQCGSAYGLKVRRHRLFLASFPLKGSGCDHKTQGRPVGVYSRMRDNIPKGGRTAETLEEGLQAMGVRRHIKWDSLKEGFPPVYTEHVGRQAVNYLRR